MKYVVALLALKTLLEQVGFVFCFVTASQHMTINDCTGGPFYALVGFSLLLVWAVPEALITAELSTAMPEASGSVGM